MALYLFEEVLVEVILQEEVPALGVEGDVVKVAPGYANNYLIPKGIAVLATPGKLKQLGQKAVGIEKRRDVARSEAQALADRFSGKSVTISAKAGAEGRLYGSVTVKDIAVAIQESFDVEIDRRRIVPADPIKEAGTVPIRIRLQADVEASLNIEVVAELVEGAEEVTEMVAAEESAEAAEENSDDPESE